MPKSDAAEGNASFCECEHFCRGETLSYCVLLYQDNFLYNSVWKLPTNKSPKDLNFKGVRVVHSVALLRHSSCQLIADSVRVFKELSLSLSLSLSLPKRGRPCVEFRGKIKAGMTKFSYHYHAQERSVISKPWPKP